MSLLILDRDGVINEDSDAFIKSPDEWRPIRGSLVAIARLNQAGHQVVVATNQSGVARGLFDLDMLMAIHKKMHAALAVVGAHIEAIFFCPHGPRDRCECRKPKPGLLLEIGERLGTELGCVPTVGDSWRDIEAARAAGAMPVLVRSGKGERTLTKHGPELEGVPVYDDLADFVDSYLAGNP